MSVETREPSLDFGRCLANYMIVLLHAWGAASQYGTVGSVELAGWTMVASYGCNFALSALFVISGYLLFRCYELSVWPRKIVRRVRRLMVPYVCWNVVFVLFYLSVARFFPRVGERVAAFGLDTWRGVLAKIAHPVAVPIDVPVWYLRAVFVFALLSPALWALLRHRVGRWIGLTAVAGWYLLDGVWGVVPGVPGYPTDALLAFSAGGLLAAGGTSPGTFFKSRWWLVPAVAALALDGWDAACGEGACPVALSLRMLMKTPAFFWALERLAGIGLFARAARLLAGSAFFVYAGHFLFCSVWVHAIGPKLGGLAAGRMTVLMFLFLVPGLAGLYAAYALGRRYLPKVLRFFDGTL